MTARRRFKHIKVVLSLVFLVILYLSLFHSQKIRSNQDNDEVFHHKSSHGSDKNFNQKWKPREDVQQKIHVDQKSTRDISYHQQYIRKHQRISNNIQELWNYMQAQVGQLKSETNIKGSVQIQRILEMTSEYKRSLLKDMEELISIEGSNRWAAEQNQRLGNLVQERLKRLQNPTDCAKVQKVYCHLEMDCGFGCQLHYLTLCLLAAYGTNRTLILNSRYWNYYQKSDRNAWNDLFQPLSNTCSTVSPDASITFWPKYDPGKDVIKLMSQSYNYGPEIRPRAVPSDIAANLVHGEPIVWWVGQFVRYIFRPNSRLRQILETHTRRLAYEHPVVGVHIRRTDKIGTEAAKHSVEEYMKHVAEYYEQLSLSENVIRRVFVATDEIGVIDEIKRKYPQYRIFGDPKITASASVDSRYTTNGLLGIVTDLYFLSKSDYLVCTFSSQICRLAYELRNADGTRDYSRAIKSLDDIWFFAGGSSHVQDALLPHQPRTPEEMSLAVEDKLLPAGNHWDGYCLGRNLRTGQTGLYPAFKVQSIVETYDGFPNYTDVT